MNFSPLPRSLHAACLLDDGLGVALSLPQARLANPPQSLRFVAIFKQVAVTTHHKHDRYYACVFHEGVDAMPIDNSLSDVLERIYHNQLILEAAVMELTLHAEKQGLTEFGDNTRGALDNIGENSGHINQGRLFD